MTSSYVLLYEVDTTAKTVLLYFPVKKPDLKLFCPSQPQFFGGGGKPGEKDLDTIKRELGEEAATLIGLANQAKLDSIHSGTDAKGDVYNFFLSNQFVPDAKFDLKLKDELITVLLNKNPEMAKVQRLAIPIAALPTYTIDSMLTKLGIKGTVEFKESFTYAAFNKAFLYLSTNVK